MQCQHQGMLARSCLLQQRRSAQQLVHPRRNTIQWLPQRGFHASTARRDDGGMPNHYATLDLPTNASPGEIKKQFYKLSKAHHPDLHPTDPNAASRFVQISEAHAVLGSAEKKARYDRDFLRATQQSHQQPGAGNFHPSGSYSSASTPAGGRPASGLSRRRTQFKGPPPSFYRSGGWGEYSEKRGEYAGQASHAHEQGGGEAAAGDGAGARPAGTGPSGFAAGFDNDVPHFDQRSHYQTHSEIEKRQRQNRAKRKQQAVRREEDIEAAGTGNSVLFNFVLLSGVLGIIYGVTFSVFAGGASSAGKKKEDSGGG